MLHQLEQSIQLGHTVDTAQLSTYLGLHLQLPLIWLGVLIHQYLKKVDRCPAVLWVVNQRKHFV